MRNDDALRPAPPHRSATDGWLGTTELPGYRAGPVVVRLDDLPMVDPDHLYFDLLLLDADGRAQDNHSGPCAALARQRPIDDRSRFVRVVAELVRHAPTPERGLAGIGQALSFIRECGIEADRLITAAQLLDNLSTDAAVTASLVQVLELTLGTEEAQREMCDVVRRLARVSGFAVQGPEATTAITTVSGQDFNRRVDAINLAGLPGQVGYVVRTVGRSKARRYLREASYFDMVPKPGLLGV